MRRGVIEFNGNSVITAQYGSKITNDSEEILYN